ncbi:MAG: hypothetical protein OXS29_13650, partial [bacterium]|nr:hypothetical protein [bacterium]MDE0437727.1 hypothetical protein [bacterium]
GASTIIDSASAISASSAIAANLAAQRVRSVNQLHALPRDPTPGGAPKALKANTAGTLSLNPLMGSGGLVGG